MFGPPFLTETCITAYRNQDQLIGKYWEVTPLPCHTLQTRSKIQRNTLQSKQEIIRIQKHPSAIINYTRPAKCLLQLTQPPEPLRVIMSSVTYPQHPATQTCICCILVVDFSTWNNVKYTVPGTKFPKLAANSTSCRISVTFHLLHGLPTPSVLSHPSRLWGPQP